MQLTYNFLTQVCLFIEQEKGAVVKCYLAVKASEQENGED